MCCSVTATYRGIDVIRAGIHLLATELHFSHDGVIQGQYVCRGLQEQHLHLVPDTVEDEERHSECTVEEDLLTTVIGRPCRLIRGRVERRGTYGERLQGEGQDTYADIENEMHIKRRSCQLTGLARTIVPTGGATASGRSLSASFAASLAFE